MAVDNINPTPLAYKGDRLKGRRVLVVGASSGIGAAAVRRFAAEGAAVIATARREERLAALCKEVTAEGGDASFVVGDVTDEESIAEAVNVAVERMGGLDGAFNAAGVGGAGRLHETEAADFDRVVAVNLRGTFLAMKYQIRAMLAGEGGAIVNTSSIGGLVAAPALTSYGATKWGVNSLTKSAAVGYAAQNIRVNAIAPAATLSEMLEQWLPTDEAKRAMAAQTPLNFIALPDDMARVALYLLSDESRWITGTVLPVDGGASAT
ncbi:SDR family NAD(P)-dependent oxidoreductase [Actinomadura macrotermitis]|uniref:Dihydroanticapsin 7-dehydrogenase n=1 Tax=Actinomadura macrotermitis TaxID=2585200 RepID=A0A7K0BZQ4_9ACTN|nr:SDR family NAD(P)-dependent oxidoreductase [Actinomadura macrotermitis]MQY06678.1 Dihydroanticapsin 7-dehydrogenase [Actinomadura macrotermitis]